MRKCLFLFVCVFINLDLGAQMNDDTAPVRLNSFNVVKSENGNKLNWSVVCLLEFASFQVEGSADATNYYSITSFKADKLRCKQPFEFEDENTAGKVFYRIKVADLDGRVYISKIVTVLAKWMDFEINSLIPTIVQSRASISISSAAAGRIKVGVYNLQGLLMRESSWNIHNGNNELQLDFSSLADGSYLLMATNSEGQFRKIRFVKH